MDILKYKRDQYDANNNNRTYIQSPILLLMLTSRMFTHLVLSVGSLLLAVLVLAILLLGDGLACSLNLLNIKKTLVLSIFILLSVFSDWGSVKQSRFPLWLELTKTGTLVWSLDNVSLLSVLWRYLPLKGGCCCLPCNHCSNWTWVIEEIWAFGTRLRSTHCRLKVK